MSNKIILLNENDNFHNCETLIENKDHQKQYYIKGIFQEAGVRNQNGRIYSSSVLMPEIERYYNKYVNPKDSICRAIGELDHPAEPSINLDRVSHKIIDLRTEGNKIYGKALIGGPKGDAVKQILDMGVQLGVSSRSLGTLDLNSQVTELQLITWDIVHEPSVSTAMMEQVVEGLEYNWLNRKNIRHNYNFTKIKESRDSLNKDRTLSKREKQMVFKSLFDNFLKNL